MIARVQSLRVAAVLALAALGLMIAATLVPRPLPVILAMSVGQGLGVVAFLLYLDAVLAEMRRLRTLDSRPPNTDDPSRAANRDQ